MHAPTVNPYEKNPSVATVRGVGGGLRAIWTRKQQPRDWNPVVVHTAAVTALTELNFQECDNFPAVKLHHH